MAKKSYKIPFDLKGNLLDCVGRNGKYYDNGWVDAVMEDNYKFHDTLEYAGYSKSRSSVHIHLNSITNNRKYHVTLKDFDKIIVNKMFNNNKIIGDFTFAKRGAIFFLVPVFPDVP